MKEMREAIAEGRFDAWRARFAADRARGGLAPARAAGRLSWKTRNPALPGGPGQLRHGSARRT